MELFSHEEEEEVAKLFIIEYPFLQKFRDIYRLKNISSALQIPRSVLLFSIFLRELMVQF